MIKNIIFALPKRKCLLAIFLLVGLSQVPAYAWEEDYYVYVSNSNEYLPAGSISYGLNEPPLLPGHDDACGVLIEDVGNIAWYFYEYGSSPPIQSFYHGGDVIVFLPLPGCGNNGTARIHINGQQILPPGGAADYILLEDGSSFRSVDKHGNLIPPTGGGHVNGVTVTDFLSENDDTLWATISPKLVLAKGELLRGDPQSRLGYLFTELKRFATEMRVGLYPSSSLAIPSRTRSGNREYNVGVVRSSLDAFIANIEHCAKYYQNGILDKAYVSCDKAKQNSRTIMARRELLRQ